MMLCAVGACWTGDVPAPAKPEPQVVQAEPEPVKEPVKPVVAPADSGSTLTADAVFAQVSSKYMGDIQRCYKDLLKSQPDAKGKVRLSFDVDETGQLVHGKALSFSTQLEDCLNAVMPGWRFPIPKDSAGNPTRADFTVTLSLVPN